MCAPAAIGPAIGAIGAAAGVSQANREKRANYQHQLKVRERKWMQTRSTYATKTVQFEQEVDQANIAAQRAYSRTQIQLNNARSLAILENQEDFKKMLANEGAIEVSAAERGVRGRSVARQLVMNHANFGISQAMISRGLAMAGNQAKESNEDVNRQLKGQLNRSFGKVAIQPIADIAPPPPVMQNVGMTLMLGMGQALGAGIEGMPANSGANSWSSNKSLTGSSYGDFSGSMTGNPFSGSMNSNIPSFGESTGFGGFSGMPKYEVPSFGGYFGGM